MATRSYPQQIDSSHWILDGEPVNIGDFIRDNEFDDETVSAILQLPLIGGSIVFGGGAFAVSELKWLKEGGGIRMTNLDLIEALRKLPLDSEVCVVDTEGHYLPITLVSKESDLSGSWIVLETKNS